MYTHTLLGSGRVKPSRARAVEDLTPLHFEQSSPLSSPTELARRLGYPRQSSGYDLRQEHFGAFVPESYSANGTWGVLIWVSPGPEPRLPAEWAAELASERILFVAAHRSGNERDPGERCRLALDAAENVRRQFRIHPQRIYIGGFSGGGRIASALGVGYADVFAGTLCICGVDFYERVPAAPGGYYLASYRPSLELIQLARRRRFVLITGEHDMNRDNTRSTAENGFKRARFSSVLCTDVPGMNHRLPDSSVLREALQYLGGSRSTEPP